MADVVHRDRCPNCHGNGWVTLKGHDYPCFVCDEDGSLVWVEHLIP